MNVNKIEVKLNDIEGSSSALASGVLQMLDVSVSRMTDDQALLFVAGTLAGIFGGLSARIGLDTTVVLIESLPKILRQAAVGAPPQGRH